MSVLGWYPPPSGKPEAPGLRLLRSPLWLLSLLWRAVAALDRVWRSRRRIRVPARVVSVGNLHVGGAGKTPAVLFLARWAVARGVKVAILSRGYGRRGRAPIALAPGGAGATAQDVGDEPLLLARGCPEARVYVGADRAAWAQQLCAAPHAPQLILLDDGFQHWPLARDVDLVVVDASVGFGNGHVLPRGPLREPLSALERASAFWIRTGSAPEQMLPLPARPRLRARYQGRELVQGGERIPLERLVGRSLVAFAGLARPEAFFESLRSAGLTLQATRAFPDHHFYTADELAHLREEAGSATLVTTEKDSLRLPPGFPHWVLPLQVALEDAGGEADALLASLLLRPA